jgi:flagellar biosynthesis protein
MSKSRYKRAVALQYSRGEGAPRVSVNGQDLEADVVVRIAHRYGVPVVEDATLAQALKIYEVDELVPPELYKAVAILFSTLDRVGKIKSPAQARNSKT